MEELAPGMGMTDFARANKVEECLPVSVAGSEAIGKMRVEEFTEELRRFPVGKPCVVEDIGCSVDA